MDELKKNFLKSLGYEEDGWTVSCDGTLMCPCGHRIEDDGECPNGHTSPLLDAGII